MASTITDSPKSAPSNSPDRSASDDNNAKTETPTTPGSNQPVPLIAHRHLGVEWPLYIQKGQRRFGPNPNCTSKPSRGAEIFLGRLPPDCFEEEIFRFVASVIEVESMYEIRVMLDPVHRGLSRRFAFVQFVNKDVAIRAVEQLNGQTIRNGFPGELLVVFIPISAVTNPLSHQSPSKNPSTTANSSSAAFLASRLGKKSSTKSPP